VRETGAAYAKALKALRQAARPHREAILAARDGGHPINRIVDAAKEVGGYSRRSVFKVLQAYDFAAEVMKVLKENCTFHPEEVSVTPRDDGNVAVYYTGWDMDFPPQGRYEPDWEFEERAERHNKKQRQTAGDTREQFLYYEIIVVGPADSDE